MRNKHKFKYTTYVRNFALIEICTTTKHSLMELSQLIYAAEKEEMQFTK